MVEWRDSNDEKKKSGQTQFGALFPLGWIGSQLALYQFSVHLLFKLTVRRKNDKGSKTPFVETSLFTVLELEQRGRFVRDLKSKSPPPLSWRLNTRPARQLTSCSTVYVGRQISEVNWAHQNIGANIRRGIYNHSNFARELHYFGINCGIKVSDSNTLRRVSISEKYISTKALSAAQLTSLNW